MKVSTSTLKKMIADVSRCKATPHLEITYYYELKAGGNKISLTSMDPNNQIESKYPIDTDGDMHVIVRGDQFTTLVNKISSEYVELKDKGTHLQVIGNGRYKVEIVSGEVFPKLAITGDTNKIDGKALVDALSMCKKAKSKNVSDGVLFGYLVNENGIQTADAIKICFSQIENTITEPILIPPTLADILQSLDREELDIIVQGNMIQFQGSTVRICGALMEGADTYPPVEELLELTYPSQCELDTKSFKDALDRLSIFISVYDENRINIAFSNEGVVMTTESGSEETVPMISSDNNTDNTYTVDVKHLSELISVISTPTFKLQHGDGETLQLSNFESKMILSINDKEE